ncbi:ras-associating and dilute domain-containing protein isoform X1 [Girardinichthys multiradiatus]|uniref:ras-associating and dilute domain-containing protein isoform X1 n=1 Tax=Girardinichthys multiradiatus TaxID=208333 RepID=UPI001FAC0F26|nr:ras-associating and dilute domain-containing protein isoform X1 [Girardinichthys multiradiatus]XP_047222703.1 ras-associating and dilute domain-containing protein isoform X1 [Girardinichthys multiradiatus]
MFYGSSSGASMSLPSKSRLKRQSRTFTQVLYRTLSYRDRVPADTGTNTRGDRRSTTEPPERPADDPAELSTQSSAPGVLKIFGDEICAGANYKSVLATPRSSAQELVKEALERYSLNKDAARSYVLCDVIGRLEGGGGWRTECLRALGDNEKPLLLQELWKPREGHARRFELRRRAEVEELNAKEKDTITAGPRTPQFLAALMGRSGLGKHRSSPLRSGRVVQSSSKDINAQARKLQRNRAKGTLTLPRSSNSSFCRSLSETSLNQLGVGEEPKRYYSTLPGPLRGRERDGPSSNRRKEEGSQGGGGGGVRHSLYQSPHLLLLQGFNRQDCLVYLLNREQHTVGQETPSARPNICLFSPDILPLHCRLRRVPAPRRHINSNNKGDDLAESQRFCVAVEPVLTATVLVNFSRCERTTTLRHGDLLSFGAHYIFLYKDPTGAKPLPAQTLARLRTLGQLYDSGVEEGEDGTQTCKMCGSVLKDKAAQVLSVPAVRRSFKPHLVKPRGVGMASGGPLPLHVGETAGRAGGQKRKLQLEFDQTHEDQLLNRIISLIEPGGDDHKLTPAYLLCLCIQHSASTFPPGSFGKLLLKIVRRIQTIAWEKTKELAQKQAQHQDPASLSLLSISDLIPDLQTIFFWMSNSIEILYFIQQRAPAYTHSIETLQGSKESLLSATITANEEAMTILEEVIMYTFQQCVYYITKALYVVLPGLLDCNPFPVDSSEPCWKGGVGFPEPVRRVLQVFQSAQELLHGYLVHPEIQAQMFAYLFFFSNVSLFNQLMDKGSARGWFQRSKALQIQACLRMVMEWATKSGLGHLAEKFFIKLNSTVSIVATPPQQLKQLSWRVLSSEHPSLKPVQLHRILTQYQLTAEIGPVPVWQPSSEDEAYIYRSVDLLESFENHPPIVLPSSGFRVDLDSECVEDSIYRQLLYVRHYLWGLRTKTQIHTSNPSVLTQSNGTNTADWPDLQRELLPPAHSSPRSGGVGDEVTAEERGRDGPPGQPQTHSLRRNGTIHHPRTANPDPSCLLTPPNTPMYPDSGGPGPILGTSIQTNGCSGRTVAECKKTNGLITNGLEGCISGCEFPFPVSSPGAPSLADDLCVVFVVELDKGPYGLGMGLIDGLHTPLNAPGIYIRTLIPDGPAASDGRLRIGDRILAVNGTSLIGADYQSAVDLIRLGGGRLRFLVAKSDPEVSEKISASSC